MIPTVTRLKAHRRQANGPGRFAWLDIFCEGSMAGTYLDIFLQAKSELQDRSTSR